MQVLSAKDASSDGASSSNSSSRASTSSSSSSSSSSSYPFFNRKVELKHLADHCSAPPDAISVIVGPRSTGKTALLTYFMSQRGLLDSRCFINARITPINTPSQLATELLASAIPKLAQQLFPDVKGLKEIVKALAGAISELQDKQKLADGSEFTLSGKVFAPILQGLAGDTRETPPLAAVCEAYIALLDAWYKARAAGKLQDDRPPVLVVDEANALMAWGDQYTVERQTLLKFFVAISKEQRRSHVILATSEYSFQTWLSKGKAATRNLLGTDGSTVARLAL
jgi:Cdc6-like AAA superfamily ATPase